MESQPAPMDEASTPPTEPPGGPPGPPCTPGASKIGDECADGAIPVGSPPPPDGGARRRPARPHPRRRGPLGRAALGVGVALALAPVLLVGALHWFGRGARSVDIAPLAHYAPPQTVRVLARDGTTLLGEIGGAERRSIVPLEDIPPTVVHAFLAAEDAHFFDHGPTDARAVARALLANLRAGELRQGASTITQQVVKNVLLDHARTIERKSQEILLAARVERELGKRHVLGVYLNAIYLGEGRYGVQAAARHYFGRDVQELDLGQAATLASLPKAPSAMSPYRDPARLRARRDWVLERMAQEGFATRADIAPFLGRPLDVLAADAERSSDAAPELVDAVASRLRGALGEEALERLGGDVITTLDAELQAQVRASLVAGLEALEARHGYGGRAVALDARRRAELDAAAPKTLEAGMLSAARVHSTADTAGLWARVGHRELLVEIPGWATISTATRQEQFPAGGKLELRITDPGATPGATARARLDPGPEGAVVLAELPEASVRALVGGRKLRRGDFDRASGARRQPGSVFKPLVYATALAQRTHTAASTLPGSEGVPRTLREALAHSDNAVAMALLAAIVGPAEDYGPLQRLAARVGIASPLRSHPSLALGTSELTPWEITRAYATLARGGVDRELRIIGALRPTPTLALDGPQLPALPPSLAGAPVEGPALDPAVAFVITDMLRSVIAEGTARQARALPFPVAGKTGTTDDARDGWFAGYSSRHVAAVWVGFDQPRSLGPHEHGASTALPIWIEVMRSAARSGPTQDFDRPPGLHEAVIDDRDGRTPCRPSARWWVAPSCSQGWFFRHCDPARLQSHPPYLRCADPESWRREWFLDGTDPDPGSATLPPGRPPGLYVAKVSIFDPAMIRDGPSLEGSYPELVTFTAALGARLRAASAEAMAPPHGPPFAPAGRTRMRLRLDPAGQLRGLHPIDATVPPPLLATLRRALASPWHGQPVPAALVDPHSGEVDLVLEAVFPSARPEPGATPDHALHSRP